jgi:UDP-N-acetylglucosamine enolpyruvyl transferase
VPIEIVNKTTVRVRGAKAVGSDVTTRSAPARDGYAGAVHGAGDAADGTSMITETIFENRYLHASRWCDGGQYFG